MKRRFQGIAVLLAAALAPGACRGTDPEQPDPIPGEGGHARTAVPPPDRTELEVTGPGYLAAQPCAGSDGRIYFASDKDGVHTNIYSKTPTGRAVRQETQDPKDERDPALSPDARYLAYAANDEGDWHIYVTRLGDGSRARVRLTRSGDMGDHRHPTWSPDGQWLAYHAFNRKQNDFHIYKVRLKFHAPEPKAEPPVHDAFRPGPHPFAPGSSPGQALSRSQDERGGGGVPPLRNSGPARTLTVAFRPFEGEGEGAAPGAAAAPGGEAPPFAVDVKEGPIDLGPGRNPSWRPYPRDGTRYQPLIAFEYGRRRERREEQVKTVWYMGAEGEQRTALVEPSAMNTWAAVTPSWAPGGNYLVYAAAGKEAAAGEEEELLGDDVYYIHYEGRQPVQVTFHAGVREFHPVWHDEYIYYQTYQRLDGDRQLGQIKAVRVALFE